MSDVERMPLDELTEGFPFDECYERGKGLELLRQVLSFVFEGRRIKVEDQRLLQKAVRDIMKVYNSLGIIPWSKALQPEWSHPKEFDTMMTFTLKYRAWTIDGDRLWEGWEAIFVLASGNAIPEEWVLYQLSIVDPGPSYAAY